MSQGAVFAPNLPTMYDSLRIFIPAQEGSIIDVLSDVKEVLNHATGEIRFLGKLANLRVEVKESGIKIDGSLAKYHLGNNFETLTRQTTQQALEKLSDTLKVTIDDARIYLLHFATNFEMKAPVSCYLRCLGEARYYEKKPYRKGLLYTIKKRGLCFYDKREESKQHHQRMPRQFETKNLLRYELKLNKRVAAQLGRRAVFATDLYDEKFYRTVLDRYIREYFSIQRLNPIQLEAQSINNVKAFKNTLAAIGLRSIGDAEVLTMIKENRATLTKDQFKRLTSCARGLSGLKGFEPSESILELDAKVSEVIKVYP